MQTFIALIRGINVSGQKKIKMLLLKAMFEDLNFHNVVTYIQSGNVIFDSKNSDTKNLEQKIEREIEKNFGFKVMVLVKSKMELSEVLASNPYNKTEQVEEGQMYFVFLNDIPKTQWVNDLQQETFANEMFVIADICIYLVCTKGYGRAKCNNNFFEKKLKVSATTRNYKTMQKLLELSTN